MTPEERDAAEYAAELHERGELGPFCPVCGEQLEKEAPGEFVCTSRQHSSVDNRVEA